jgi:hypothetical protein
MGPYTRQRGLGTGEWVYPAGMSETPAIEVPVANYTEDAVSGFGEPLPGGMPVLPDLTPDEPEVDP